MAVRVPTSADVTRIANSFGMELSPGDFDSFVGLIKGVLSSYERVDELAEPKPRVKYPRTSGYRPEPKDNPLNGWYWRTEVKGAAKGPLAGRTIALKDTTCLAGVPMMNGTAVLEGYVPDFDATIAERILDAGGTIVGKAACEKSLLFGRQPHESSFSRAQPTPARLFSRRIFKRQCSAGFCGRSQYGNGW